MEEAATFEYGIGNARIFMYGKPRTFKTLVREWREQLNFNETARIANELGLKSVAVPQVYTFNAKVAAYEDFPKRHRIDGVVILTGLEADAVILKPKQAAGIVTGDCPTLVIENTKTGSVAAAHAGRDSNIDRKLIDTGAPSRPHEGIVASILNSAKWRPEDLRVLVCGGIAPAHFEHSWNDANRGETNRAMTEWIIKNYGEQCIAGNREEGRIDLFALIRSQCLKFGIPAERIRHDGVDTHTHPRLWSHRNPEKREGRNMVIVANRAF